MFRIWKHLVENDTKINQGYYPDNIRPIRIFVSGYRIQFYIFRYSVIICFSALVIQNIQIQLEWIVFWDYQRRTVCRCCIELRNVNFTLFLNRYLNFWKLFKISLIIFYKYYWNMYFFQLYNYFAIVAIVFCISVFWVLTFELPMLKLEKLCLIRRWYMKMWLFIVLLEINLIKNIFFSNNHVLVIWLFPLFFSWNILRTVQWLF